MAPGAFDAYGDTGLEVLIEMLRNPFRPIGDLLAEENVAAAWCGCWRPCSSCRSSRCASWCRRCRCTALYFVADVPVTGADGGGRIVPLVAFAFVAAPFALARLGRQSVERVLVDRRLLALLGVGRRWPPC